MRTLGDVDGLAPVQTYIDVTSSTYDPAQGSVVEITTEYPGIQMVLARFKIDEMDDMIVPTTDQKALIAALDLPVTPKVQDKIRLSTGENYMVMRILGVPGESIHIIHIRLTE